MTNRDFFYWLQGAFELCLPKGARLTSDKASVIEAHVNLVTGPCERLIEVRTYTRLLKRDPPVEQAIGLTDDMRTVVSEYFLHVVDPQDGGPEEQAKLNAIHAANPHLNPNTPKRPDGAVARC